MRGRTSLQGLAMLLVTAFAWGLNWPVLKLALGEWPPFVFRVFSGLGGAALMLAVALARGDTLRPPRGQFGRLVIASILNVSSWSGLATFALLWLDASEAAILAYTMPIWAAIFAWPILGERPTLPRIAGLVLGLGGVGVLLGGQVMNAPMADFTARLPGVACILGTACLFALGAVFTKRYPINLPPVSNVAWQSAIGGTPMFIAAFFFDRWDFSRIDGLGWALLFYVGVVAIGVAYLAWFRALRLLPASTAAVGSLLIPVIGVLSSGIVLGEPLGVVQFLALLLTMGGVVLASRG